MGKIRYDIFRTPSIIIARLQHTSTLRLLRQFDGGHEPILKHIGPRSASVYIATKHASCNL